MKIKQQKQIKSFLIEEFGKDKGSALFDEQEKALIYGENGVDTGILCTLQQHNS